MSALPPPSQPARDSRRRHPRIVIVAGGDVDYGRMRGERLLREPTRNDLAPFAKLFAGADLRFVNLESTISDLQAGPARPAHPLVFTAPPIGADALARARIDIVSLANNHAWDYGHEGLLQTFANLERVKIAYAGAGRAREEAYGPRLVEAGGWRIAFVAVTAIWNQQFSPHPGKQFVADAAPEPILEAIRKARELGADRVLLSYHGGDEYVDAPREDVRAIALSAMAAGADAFIGHHPHVLRRAALMRGKPVFYSLGNLLMRMKSGTAWTEYGALARLVFDNHGGASAALCPYRLFGLDPLLLANDPQRGVHERRFRATFDRLLAAAAFAGGETAVRLGALDSDGCAELTPR